MPNEQVQQAPAVQFELKRDRRYSLKPHVRLHPVPRKTVPFSVRVLLALLDPALGLLNLLIRIGDVFLKCKERIFLYEVSGH